MRARLNRSVVFLSFLLFTPAAMAQPPQDPLVRAAGSDVQTGSVYDARSYGTQTVAGEPWRALAIGAELWNTGDRPVEWNGTTANHTVIFQNLYRADGTGFRQIGMSWGKHVVATANMPFDTSYGPCVSPGFTALGVNCEDVYSSQQNAGQSRLGPRYEVNPATGAFTYPFTGIVPPVQTGDTLARRLIVLEADIQTGTNPGAVYFAESALFGADDSRWGNAGNNYGSRTLGPFPALSPTGEQALTFSGPSSRGTALEYWAWATPGVSISRAEFHEQNATVTDKWQAYQSGDTSAVLLPQSQWVSVQRQVQARFIAAGAASDNGDGTWTYRYAVLNVNSHRAASALSLALPAGAVVGSTSFSAPSYHSGDRVRNTAWAAAAAAGRLVWTMDPATEVVTLPSIGAVTFEPNALRFATVYSFSAVINKAPASSTLRLRLWRPPADAAGDQITTLAFAGLPAPAACAADVGSAGGVSGPDAQLDNNDFIAFIDAFFTRAFDVADLAGPGAAPSPDGLLDNNDFVAFIDAFFSGCS